MEVAAGVESLELRRVLEAVLLQAVAAAQLREQPDVELSEAELELDAEVAELPGQPVLASVVAEPAPQAEAVGAEVSQVVLEAAALDCRD